MSISADMAVAIYTIIALRIASFDGFAPNVKLFKVCIMKCHLNYHLLQNLLKKIDILELQELENSCWGQACI